MADHGTPDAEQLIAELAEARRRLAAFESESVGGAMRRLTDSMSDGFSLLSPDGVHLDVNPALCAMTGFSRDELIDAGPPHPYWPPEEYGLIEADFARTLSGDTATNSLTFMRKNGERFPALVTPAVLRDEHGAMVSVFATVKDVSELRRAEAALAESERMFRLTFDQAPIGAALVGLDFRFRRVNARFARMTGYTVDELMERGFPDITHPDDVARDVVQVRRLAAGEIEEYAREKRYVRKDGSNAWGDVVVRPIAGDDGLPLAFVAMVADVTERRRAEQEVRREHESLSRLIDSIPDEVWLADAKGRFTLANPAALREFGAGAADDTAVLDVAASLEILRTDGTPRPLTEAPPLRALAGEVVRNQEEIVRTPTSGELRHRLVNATPVRDPDGAVVGCVSVVRDVTELRRAERALERERERAKTYLDIAGVMLVAIAADQTVLFANRKTCEVLGRDEAEVVGHDWFDTTLPEAEREAIRDAFAQLMAANVAPWQYVENRVVTSGGDERLIAWHNTVLKDEHGTIVATLSSGEDITARRQMEQLLGVPAEILGIMASPRPLRETVDDIVAALKKATGFDAVGLRLREGEDYPFLGAVGYSDEFLRAESTLAVRYADGGLCRNEGGSVSLECTCGLVVSGKTDPTDPLFTPGGSAWTNDSLPFLEVAPEDDPRLNPRNRCIHVGFRSLALVPLRAGDEILGLVHLADRRTDRFTPESIDFFEGLATSIGVALARRRADERVEEAFHYARSLIEASLDPLATIAPDGRITDVNQATERVTGVSREQLIGTDFSQYFTRPDKAEAGYRQVFESGFFRDLPLTIRHASGAVTDVLYNATVYRDQSGAVAGVFAAARDITERKQAEEEIRRLNAELQDRVVSRTEQLEAATHELEGLAYSMAHDVRAPLRAIDGFSALVMDDEGDRLTPESRDSLRRVREAAQTLARLMDDLVGLSKLSSRELVRRRVDVSALAAEVANETAADNPSLQVDFTVEPGLSAEADPRLVRVILHELLANAWKFSAPHGSARVAVGARDVDGERAFYVRDDGVGFDVDYAKHLFGVFQRMHPTGQFAGDGVGLAMVQRLVRRHGGHCWAEAEVGKGATFSFTLPPASAEE